MLDAGGYTHKTRPSNCISLPQNFTWRRVTIRPFHYDLSMPAPKPPAHESTPTIHALPEFISIARIHLDCPNPSPLALNSSPTACAKGAP
eukprot:scaffold286178_cov31-Tisochrysis_lutea.AAC.2